MSSISNTVTHAVQLGVGGYTSPLIVTATGAIEPAVNGSVALSAGPGLTGVVIRNAGYVFGGAGSQTLDGGAGVQIMCDAFLVNSRSIGGGSVDEVGSTMAGGAGVILGAAAVMNNSGTISGGGTDSRPVEGNGGAGVDLTAASVLINTGEVYGGTALNPFVLSARETTYTFGNGGIGVNASGTGSLTNKGEITGGAGYHGGIGVDLSQSSVFSNHGTVIGGAGADGAVGLSVGTGCTATNGGGIIGGSGYDNGGYGALVAAAGMLTNLGTISGGDTQPIGYSREDSFGVNVDGGTLVNAGLVEGGLSRGGLGVALSSGYISNVGRIAGDEGAQIAGGTLFNSGAITADGVGVFLSAGTLVTSGRITGNPAQSYANGDAVVLSPVDNTATLIVEAGASFSGKVQATDGGVTVLELGGSTAGTLGLLGTEFTGFNIMEVASDSSWVLRQLNTVAADQAFYVDGSLTVSGVLQDAGALTVRDGELTVSANGAARAQSVTLAGGTLAGAAGGRLAVGDNVSAAAAGAVTVDASGTITGYGTISAPDGIVDNGIINAGDLVDGEGGGALSFIGPVSGAGAIDLAAHGTVYLDGNVTVAKLAFASDATVFFDTTNPVSTHISGFGTGDTITLDIAAATDAQYANGVLSVYDTSILVDQLNLTGSYTSANFAVKLITDGNSYVDVDYVASTAGAAHGAILRDEGCAATWHDAIFAGDR